MRRPIYKFKSEKRGSRVLYHRPVAMTVPAGRGPAGTRLKAGRASACWTLLLPRTHLCQELAQSSLGEVDLVLDWPWPVASRIQRCHLPLDWTF